MFKKKPHVFKKISTREIWRFSPSILGRIMVLCTILVLPCYGQETPGSEPDVRVVVDISGSMKKNDPKNLRVPAVRLLTNLLPSNAYAGIWTFGQYVNDLVPSQVVNDDFRRLATAKSSEISSAGLFTNIGGALERAAKDWRGKPSTGARHIILLTDGVVDVSKDPEENEKARFDLFARLLPELKSQQAKVHTIALSLEADMDLLRKLALETGGNFEQAQNAEDLNRAFLRLFEQAAPRDSLPLNDNNFQVDQGAEEITLLVFKKPASAATEIRTPDGKVHKQTAMPLSWRWHSENAYDLITIPQPPAGAWKIIADIDPENRVLVVSKLKLQVAEIPSVALAGEEIALSATLFDSDKPLANEAFAKLVEAKARVVGDGYQKELVLNRDGLATFNAKFAVPALDMSYLIEVELRSSTFARQRRLTVRGVASPVKSNVVVEADGTAKVKLLVDQDLFATDSMTLSVSVETPKKESYVPEFSSTAEGYQLSVLPSGNGSYQLHYELQAKTAAGRDISLKLPALEWQVEGLEMPAEPALETPVPVEESAQANGELKADSTSPDPHASKDDKVGETTPDLDAEKAHGWVYWLVVGLGVNVVVFGLAGGVWWWLKRRRKNTELDINKELGIGGTKK